MKDLEFNKIAAAVLLAGLIIMIGGFITDLLYKPDVKIKKRGYEIAVANKNDNMAAAAPQEEKIDIFALMKLANIEKGMVVAKKCTR